MSQKSVNLRTTKTMVVIACDSSWNVKRTFCDEKWVISHLTIVCQSFKRIIEILVTISESKSMPSLFFYDFLAVHIIVGKYPSRDPNANTAIVGQCREGVVIRVHMKGFRTSFYVSSVEKNVRGTFVRRNGCKRTPGKPPIIHSYFQIRTFSTTR